MSANTQRVTSITRARDCRSSTTQRRRPLGELKESSRSKPRTVERLTEASLPTEFGEFRILGYRSLISNEDFVVLVCGKLSGDLPALVRIHSQCLTGDVFGSLKCDCGNQLRSAMEMIARQGRGLVVYQQQEGRGIGIINKIRAYALQDKGADTIEANEQLGFDVDLRCYGQCAEILHDLNVKLVRLMSNNPEKIRALEDAGLKVVERIALETLPSEAAKSYLRTKKEKMGHLLELV